MTTSTVTHTQVPVRAAKPRRRFAAAALATAGLLTAGLATTAAAAPAQAAAPHATARASVTNYVAVDQALLRSQPNRDSTKLDVANRGNGIDLYCWVPSAQGGANYIWFKAHFWGGRYTGWIRADLVQWNSYPSPYRC